MKETKGSFGLRRDKRDWRKNKERSAKGVQKRKTNQGGIGGRYCQSDWRGESENHKGLFHRQIVLQYKFLSHTAAITNLFVTLQPAKLFFRTKT